MSGVSSTGMERQHGFAMLRSELFLLLEGLQREEIYPGDPNTLATLWSPADLKRLGDIMAAARSLVAEGAADARRHRTEALDAVMQRSLGRAFGPPSLTASEREKRELATPDEFDLYDALADDLVEVLTLFAEDTSASPAPSPDSPDGERDYAARRLGRTRAGLDSLVSKWKAEHGADLPWVVRKDHMPWFVNPKVFEEWRRTSDGEKATVKRARGRPLKRPFGS